MKAASGLILALCLTIAAGDDYNRLRRYLNVDIDEVGSRVSDYLDCKKVSESCRLVPSCCGSLQCYWEHGYNPLQAGRCVTCIEGSQKCQRCSQCCAGMVCQKATVYDVDGVCGTRKAQGSECYMDNQCATRYCDISWYNMIKGSGGKCQPL